VSVQAPELPKDVTMVSARNIPGEKSIQFFSDSMPVFADTEVNYVGEPLALLVGPSREVLFELAEQVECTYEEMPAVFSFEPFSEEQVSSRADKEWGEPDAAFEESYQTLVGEYRTGVQDHHHSEPHGALAYWEKGIIVVRCQTRWPHLIHRAICAMLGLRKDQCSVRPTSVGVAFDAHLLYPALLATEAALAAHVTGRAVRLVLDRREDFLYSFKRAPVFVKHTSAVDQNGNLKAVDIRIQAAAGAYPLFAEEMGRRLLVSALGSYRSPSGRISVRCIRTNVPPLNFLSGLGDAQAQFAMEIQASRIVEVAQVDPLEWKANNLLQAGDRTLTSAELAADSDSSGLLTRLAEQADFARKHAAFELQKKRRQGFSSEQGPVRGIGISFGFVGSGLSGNAEEGYPHSARVRLDQEGRAHIFTSAVPANSAVEAIWKRNAVQILGVGEDMVSIAPVDTSAVPDSGPSVFSRNVTIVNRLIENCCTTIKSRRFRSPLPIEVKKTFKLPRKRRWIEDRFEGNPFPLMSWAAACCEVDVDPTTLEVAIRGLWLVMDAGIVFNEKQARLSVEREIIQALRWARMEQPAYRQGSLSDHDYYAYHTTGHPEIDRVSLEFVQPKTASAPKAAANRAIGYKGVGGLAQSCVPAAYVNAVTQATGCHIDRIPATPRLIHAYLEEE
jgi:CO/xanthine dehydrogenase Mo-binding subunit